MNPLTNVCHMFAAELNVDIFPYIWIDLLPGLRYNDFTILYY